MYFNGTKTSALIFCSFMSLSVMAKDVKTTVAGALRKPLCFIENKGQVRDGQNNPFSEIQYKLSSPGMSLYVGKGQLSYQFRKIDNSTSTPGVSGYTMNVNLLGANPDAKVIATDEQDYYENYFSGNNPNGLTAHSFNKVTYKEIYPGIDWVLYIKNDKVEYDFVIRPGADASNIRLKYGGATALSISKDGGIIAETPMGKVEENKPYTYETISGKAVTSRFVLRNNVVSFETGKHSGSLTIDPFLQWSTYFGGAAEDVVTSVKADALGNTYIAGYSAAGAFVLTGPYAFNNGGAYDAFLAKYNSNGSIAWSTYYGGAADDRGTCLAVDNSNNVYLGGYTNSVAGPAVGQFPQASPGSFHPVKNAGYDGFIVKFTSTGTRSWSTFYGGPGDDYINAIVCDATASYVYVAGQTSSTTNITAGTPYQLALSGTTDAFLGKIFAATGGLGAGGWSTYYGGSAQDNALGLAWDAVSSNIVMTGQTSSIINIASPGAYQTALSGTNDGFIAKFSPGGGPGSRIWGTYFGGAGTEQIKGVACHPVTGGIAVTGSTTSFSNVATPRSYQQVYGGGLQDAFVGYFTPTGTLSWSSYYGGTAPEYGEGICFDKFNNIVIAGGSFSSNGIASPAGTFNPRDAMQISKSGDYDAYLAKFNTFGQRLWGSYFGDVNYDYANAVTCDLASDHIVLGGYTTSPANIAITPTVSQFNPAQTTYMGGIYDGFVTKFSSDTLVWINQPYTDTLVCAGGTLTLNFSSNFSFQPGNTISVQMSDAAGSFVVPTVIGSVVSVPLATTGTVTCTVPAATPLGLNYRLRLVANNPQFVSPDNFANIEVRSSLAPTVITGSNPVCVGYPLSLFDASGYTVTNYSWAGPAGSGASGTGFTSSLQNPVNMGVSGLGVTFADSGTYYVTTSHNGCPDLTSSFHVAVNNVHPPIPTDSASTPVCTGKPLQLFANMGVTSGGHSYHWTGPSLFSSSLQNPIISSPVSGLYFVNDTVAGCASNSVISITVETISPVSVNVTVSPSDTVCAGVPVTFTAHPVNGGHSPAYQWMSGPSSPIVGAVSSTFSSSSLVDGSSVFCILYSSLACPSVPSINSNNISMNVINTPPIVYIYANPGNIVTPGTTVILNSVVYNGGIAPTFQWKLNNVDIPGAVFSSCVLTDVRGSDTISLEVNSTMACATPAFSTSNYLVVQSNEGVRNLSSNLDDVRLYPNPNNGSFNVTGSITNGKSGTVSFEVINPLGQTIYSGQSQLQNDKLDANIELQHISGGLYLLRISNEGENKTFRFSVQH